MYLFTATAKLIEGPQIEYSNDRFIFTTGDGIYSITKDGNDFTTVESYNLNHNSYLLIANPKDGIKYGWRFALYNNKIYYNKVSDKVTSTTYAYDIKANKTETVSDGKIVAIVNGKMIIVNNDEIYVYEHDQKIDTKKIKNYDFAENKKHEEIDMYSSYSWAVRGLNKIGDFGYGNSAYNLIIDDYKDAAVYFEKNNMEKDGYIKISDILSDKKELTVIENND